MKLDTTRKVPGGVGSESNDRVRTTKAATTQRAKKRPVSLAPVGDAEAARKRKVALGARRNVPVTLAKVGPGKSS